MDEINNVIDAEFEEVIEEPAEKNWKKHLKSLRIYLAQGYVFI